MSKEKMEYIQARTVLLEQITSTLQKDERFVAAWLAGSFGRGEETWLSDLYLHVGVSNAYAPSLCATPWLEGPKTTEDPIALFPLFGPTGFVFERNNHPNHIRGILTNV